LVRTQAADVPLQLGGAWRARHRSWRRLRHHPLFWIGAVILVFLVLFCFAVPLVWHPSTDIDVAAMSLPPSLRFPLGTDALGRNNLWTMMIGGHLPIVSGFAAAVAATALGTATGLGAALYRRLEAPLLRLADAILGIPQIVPVLIAEAILGVHAVLLIGVVTLTLWPATTRLVWARALVLRELPYVDAARAGGASGPRILLRHVLPNSADTVIASFASQFGNAVLFIAIAALPGIGAGLGFPADWATMVATGFNMSNWSWWLFIPPGACLALLIISVFLICEALRQALDPYVEGGGAA